PRPTPRPATGSPRTARHRPPRGTCTRSRRRPLAERGEQPLLELRRDVLRAQTTRGRDRRAHLLQVVRAAVAEHEMLLDALAVFGIECVLEVGGDELDELGA